MKLALYQIDAFTSKIFSGNPAAVVPLETWLSDPVMQSIAMENNLSETAFFIPKPGGFHIRWFTPADEVDLCGHATLAAAHVIFKIMGHPEGRIVFESRSGDLYVRKENKKFVMDFPSQPPSDCTMPEPLESAFRIKPLKCLKSEDYIVIFDSPDDILALDPDMDALKKLDMRGVIATSKGNEGYDFMLRFFCPKYGVPEDPVTGSAFTQLAPLWAGILDKNTFKACQMSKRGGEVCCLLKDDRVEISGETACYLEGFIEVEV